MKKRTESLGEIAKSQGKKAEKLPFYKTFNDISSKKLLTSENWKILEIRIEEAKSKKELNEAQTKRTLAQKELNEAQTKRTLARVIVMNSIASWFLVISIVVSTNSISNPTTLKNISLIIGPQVTLLKGVISHYFKNKR